MTVLALGPFDLETHIATGGMGQVWKGKHRLSDLDVAIKVLTGRSSQQSRFRETFQNEARAMSGPSHQNIPNLRLWGNSSRQRGRGILWARPSLSRDGILDWEPRRATTRWNLGGPPEPPQTALSSPRTRAFQRRSPSRPKARKSAAQQEGQIKLTDFGIAFATDQGLRRPSAFEPPAPPNIWHRNNVMACGATSVRGRTFML